MSKETAFFDHAVELLHASGAKPILFNDTVYSKSVKAHFNDQDLELTLCENIASKARSLTMCFTVKTPDHLYDIFGITFETQLSESLEIWRSNMIFASEKKTPINFRALVFLTALLAYQP